MFLLVVESKLLVTKQTVSLWHLTALLALGIVSSPASSHAEPLPLSADYDGRTITSIDYEIEGTLDVDALERALRLGVGDTLDAEAWQADAQALLNMGFFRRIETFVLRANETSVALLMRVKTNWSLLPFLAFEGGAVPVAILGGFYGNAFGQMVGVGGYYMRRGPYNLGRAWVMLPHLVMPRSLIDIELVLTGDTVAFFPGDESQATPEQRDYYGTTYRWQVPRGGIEVLRRGAYADFGFQPIAERLTLSLRYGLFQETQIALDNLPAVIDADNRNEQDVKLVRGESREATLSLLSATAIVGQVNLIDNYLFRGHELRAVAIGSSYLWGSARDFVWLYLSYRGFFELAPRFDLGTRLTLAHSTSDDPVDDWNLGGQNLEPFIYNQRHPGLFSIRGLRPNQFRGQEMVFANIEPRYTILREQRLGLAGDISIRLAAFIDAGRAWTGDALPAGFRHNAALVAGGGMLVTLLDFRFTYVNWYIARVLAPFSDNVFGIIVTRQFF